MLPKYLEIDFLCVCGKPLFMFIGKKTVFFRRENYTIKQRDIQLMLSLLEFSLL